MIDYKQLNYFVAVVETGSFTAASKKLNISRQAVTKSIKHLEESLGFPIIKQESNLIQLTELGQSLLNEGRILLEAYQKFESTISSLTKPSLTIAHVNCIDVVCGGDITLAFQEKHPEILIEMEQTFTDEVLSMIENGGAEIGLVGSCPELIHDFDYLLIKETPLDIQIPNLLPISKKDIITIEDCRELPLVTAGKRNHVHQFFEKKCNEFGFSPHIIYSTSNEKNMINHVTRNKEAFFCFPEELIPPLNGFTIKEISFPINPRFGLYAIKKKNRCLSPNPDLFWKYLKDRVR